MYCNKCGHYMNDDDKFCYQCGAVAQPVAEDKSITTSETKEAKESKKAATAKITDETEAKDVVEALPEDENVKKSRKGLWIVIACIGVVALSVAIAFTVFKVFSSNQSSKGKDNGDSSYNYEAYEEATDVPTAEPTSEPTNTPSPEPSPTPTVAPTLIPTPAPTTAPQNPYKVGSLTVTVKCNFTPEEGVWRGGFCNLHFAGEDQDYSRHEYDGSISGIDIAAGQTKTFTFDIKYDPKYNDLTTADFTVYLESFVNPGMEDDYNCSRSESYSTYNGKRYLSGLTITLSK